MFFFVFVFFIFLNLICNKVVFFLVLEDGNAGDIMCDIPATTDADGYLSSFFFFFLGPHQHYGRGGLM